MTMRNAGILCAIVLPLGLVALSQEAASSAGEADHAPSKSPSSHTAPNQPVEMSTCTKCEPCTGCSDRECVQECAVTGPQSDYKCEYDPTWGECQCHCDYVEDCLDMLLNASCISGTLSCGGVSGCVCNSGDLEECA